MIVKIKLATINLGFNWIDILYYSSHTDLTNRCRTYQLYSYSFKINLFMDTRQQHNSNYSSLLFVAFIVFIDMSGLGLIIPVLPSLIQSLDGGTVARAAEIGGWLLFSYAIMQFLFAPIIGGLSDRFGRRPVLLITLFLLGLDYAIMAWAPTLEWLFLGRIIAGVMGASWTAANSCVADIASSKDKAKYFGLLGGAGAAGFVLGPAIGGLLGQYGDRVPFIVASALALGGVLVGYFKLTETLPIHSRRKFSIERANPFGSLIQISRTPVVLGFLSVIFVLQLAAQTQIAVWAYYLIERFAWSELQIGLSVALYGITIGLMQGVVTGPVTARFGNVRTGFISILLGFPAYLIIAFAPNSWFILLGIIYGSISAVAFPAMQAMMSSEIAEDAQGELQGAICQCYWLNVYYWPCLNDTDLPLFCR